jgi:hypothetical protein
MTDAHRVLLRVTVGRGPRMVLGTMRFATQSLKGQIARTKDEWARPGENEVEYGVRIRCADPIRRSFWHAGGDVAGRSQGPGARRLDPVPRSD